MSLLGNIWVKLGLKSDDFNHGLDTAEKKSNRFGNLMKGVAAKVLTVAAALKAVASTFRTLANFEAATSKLASVLGKSTADIKDLTQSAIDLGRRTQYTASQVVDLQTELAKLGFAEGDIRSMQESVLKFAAAVGTDLASAAARAGATMRGFGLSAEETGDLLEVMAVSTSKSALSFNYLDATLGKLIPVTKAYGFSSRDTIALLGTMANAGIDASSAGTALRRVFVELSNGSSKLNQVIGKQPKTMEELIEALTVLREKNLSVAESSDLVGKYAAPAFAALVNGADDCRTLYGELQNVNGALDDMYATMTQNVKGAIEQVKSGWEGLILTLQNSTGPIAQVLTRFARGLNVVSDLVGGLGLGGAKVKQMGETILSSGQFKTAEDLRKEIERVTTALETATGRNKKTLERYLDGLNYAAFQRSQEEQRTAIDNMFREPIPGGGDTGTESDPLADLLGSLGKEEEAKKGIINQLENEIKLKQELRNAAENSTEINNLNAQIKALQNIHDLLLGNTGGALHIADTFQDIYLDEAALAEEIEQLFQEHNESLDKWLEDLAKKSQMAEEIAQGFHEAITQSVVGSLEYLAEALGSGEWDTAGFVKSLIGPLADAAISAGTLILTTGTALESLKEALIDLFGGGPTGAIIAGGALVAMGLAAKAGLAAIATSGGKGGSGGGAYSNPYTYAGGYGAAVTPATGYGSALEITGDVVVKGQDLHIALSNYENNRSR